MKKITILMIMIITISSCSKTDAEKVCDLTTQSREMMDKIYSASITVASSTEWIVRKAGKKKLEEAQAELKEINAEFDNIMGKYDEDEFQAYLLENCEGLKEMTKMGEALQGIGDSIDNN